MLECSYQIVFFSKGCRKVSEKSHFKFKTFHKMAITASLNSIANKLLYMWVQSPRIIK